MTISRQQIAIFFLLALALGPARATDCHCAKKIQRLQHQLYHLAPQGAEPAKVSRLVLKLSKLQPRYANRYFRWGISKLPYAGYNSNADQLSREVIRIVKNSDLTSKGVTKITTQIKQAVEDSSVPPVSPAA